MTTTDSRDPDLIEKAQSGPNNLDLNHLVTLAAGWATVDMLRDTIPFWQECLAAPQLSPAQIARLVEQHELQLGPVCDYIFARHADYAAQLIAVPRTASISFEQYKTRLYAEPDEEDRAITFELRPHSDDFE